MNALERKGMMATILETDVLYPTYNPSNHYENEDFKDFGCCRCNMMDCNWVWDKNKLNSLSDDKLNDLYEKIIQFKCAAQFKKYMLGYVKTASTYDLFEKIKNVTKEEYRPLVDEILKRYNEKK